MVVEHTLEQEGSVYTSSLGSIRLRHRCAAGRSVGSRVLVVEYVLGRHSEIKQMIVGDKKGQRKEPFIPERFKFELPIVTTSVW